MSITFHMSAGRCTLSINGVSAPLRDKEDVSVAWHVIRLALFNAQPERAIAKLLRDA